MLSISPMFSSRLTLSATLRVTAGSVRGMFQCWRRKLIVLPAMHCLYEISHGLNGTKRPKCHRPILDTPISGPEGTVFLILVIVPIESDCTMLKRYSHLPAELLSCDATPPITLRYHLAPCPSIAPHCISGSSIALYLMTPSTQASLNMPQDR